MRPADLRDVYQLRKPVQAFQLLDAVSASILNGQRFARSQVPIEAARPLLGPEPRFAAVTD